MTSSELGWFLLIFAIVISWIIFCLLKWLEDDEWEYGAFGLGVPFLVLVFWLIRQ